MNKVIQSHTIGCFGAFRRVGSRMSRPVGCMSSIARTNSRSTTSSKDTNGTNALVDGDLSIKAGKREVLVGVNWQGGSALKSVAGWQLG
jgi:hypothetical protein